MNRNGSDFARRAAQQLLRWYPKPWRLRYGGEMRELVDEMPVRWRQVADLSIGAGREWLSPRAFGWPARSAAEAIQFVRGCKFLLLFIILDVVARAVAERMETAGVTLPAAVGATAVALFIALAVRGLVATLSWQRVDGRKRWPQLGRVGPAEFACWLVVLFVLHLFNLTHPPRNWDVIGRVLSLYAKQAIAFHLLFNVSDRSRRLGRIVTAHRKRLADAQRDAQRF